MLIFSNLRCRLSDYRRYVDKTLSSRGHCEAPCSFEPPLMRRFSVDYGRLDWPAMLRRVLHRGGIFLHRLAALGEAQRPRRADAPEQQLESRTDVALERHTFED